MRIEKLEIGHFGKFNGYTLEFADGFSVLYGDNENGKSTILECLRMVFYGTSGRGTDPVKNPRIKYLPWNGSRMSAAVVFEDRGRRYRLERAFGKTNAGDRIKLADALTGEVLPCTGEPGEQFFGMGSSAFEKSLFIGQLGSFSSTGDKEDETNRRLANLVSTGDENASYTQVAERLRKAAAGLASPRSVGTLDKQLQHIEELQEDLSQAKELEKKEILLRNRKKERLLEWEQLELREKQIEKLLQKKQRLKEIEALRREREQALLLEELKEKENLLEKQMTGMNGQKIHEELLQQAEKFQQDLGVQNELFAIARKNAEDKEAAWQTVSVLLEETQKNGRKIPSVEEMQELRRLCRLQQENSEMAEKARRVRRLKSQLLQVKAAREGFENCSREEERLEGLYKEKEEARAAQQRELEKLQKELDLLDQAENQHKWQLEQEQKKEAEQKAARKKKKLLRYIAGAFLIGIGAVLGVLVHPVCWALSGIGLLLLLFGWLLGRKNPSGNEIEKLQAALGDIHICLRDLRDQEISMNQVLMQKAEEADAEEEEWKKLQKQTQKKAGILSYCEEQMKLFLQTCTEEEIKEAKASLFLPEEEQNSERDQESAMRGLLAAYACDTPEELEEMYREYTELFQKKSAAEIQYTAAKEEMLRKQENVFQLVCQLKEMLSPFAKEELKKEENFRELLENTKILLAQHREIQVRKNGILQALGKPPEALPRLEELLAEKESLLKTNGEIEDIPEDVQLQLENEQKLIRHRKEALQLEEGTQAQQITSLWEGKHSVSQLERELTEEKASAKEKRENLEALKIAGEAMESAFRELQSGYGPLLNTASAEILSRLTDGRYTSMLVDKSFELSVMEKGESDSREWKYLSSGTVDQAYFALRLAISNLLTAENPQPLFLDDIFTQYDDMRTKRGLRFLSEYAEEKGSQIFLFTCHNYVVHMAEEQGASVGKI